jgi:dolichol-phosphate mannosyltransferase
MKISLVIPVYNEGNGVRSAHDTIISVMGSRLPNHEFELIFVDDGSSDDSFVHLADLAGRHPYVRVIKFASNCGSHMAIRAGLEHARGDVATFLACDLQDPPETVPAMLGALSDSVEIVWAVRVSRQDRWIDRILSWTFHGLTRLLISKNIPPSGASMALIGPRALKNIRMFMERNLTLDGLLSTMGYRQTSVEYERRARESGTSKWTLAKRLKLFADQFVGYSFAPIRLMSYLGMACAALGILITLWMLLKKFILSSPILGWTVLLGVVLLLSGLQMTLMGVMGEYIWRALDEVRARPRYIIEKILN